MKHWTHLLMKTGMSLEKENMIWNMTGSFFYAFASMVLSFLVLRIAGEEQGGIFSFGFSTVGQQMFFWPTLESVRSTSRMGQTSTGSGITCITGM